MANKQYGWSCNRGNGFTFGIANIPAINDRDASGQIADILADSEEFQADCEEHMCGDFRVTPSDIDVFDINPEDKCTVIGSISIEPKKEDKLFWKWEYWGVLFGCIFGTAYLSKHDDIAEVKDELIGLLKSNKHFMSDIRNPLQKDDPIIDPNELNIYRYDPRDDVSYIGSYIE